MERNLYTSERGYTVKIDQTMYLKDTYYYLFCKHDKQKIKQKPITATVFNTENYYKKVKKCRISNKIIRLIWFLPNPKRIVNLIKATSSQVVLQQENFDTCFYLFKNQCVTAQKKDFEDQFLVVCLILSCKVVYMR